MTTIRTGNLRAAIKTRIRVHTEGRTFHESYVQRMFRSGTTHKLSETRFHVKTVRRAKALRREMAREAARSAR